MTKANTQPPQLDPQTFVLFQEMMAMQMEQMRTMVAAVQEIAEAVKQERLCSPWLNPEEASLLLGINITDKGFHKRKLSALTKKGLLSKFKIGQPVMYWKAEVQALAIQIAEGKVDYL